MSKINKVQVDNIIYDIEDASIPSWARENEKPIYKYEELEDLPIIPSKTSELENDTYFIKSTENAYFTNGVRMYNHNTQSDGRKVDLLVEHIQGVGYGGYEDDLYLNHRSSNDVRVLEDGAGTFYYKGKEVADREYVDEKIADIEIGGGGIAEIPIASATTLGGIKVGANLTIDEDGTLNAQASGGEGGNTYINSLPIGSVIAFDGDEIPEGFEEVKNYIPTYSLEETRIGTWYNGKPIYRKVIQTTTPATANEWIDIDTGIENIDEHISKNISYKINTLTYFADAYENSTYRFLAVLNGSKVSVLVGVSSWCSKPMTMVLEYTKTTDEGGIINETN